MRLRQVGSGPLTAAWRRVSPVHGSMRSDGVLLRLVNHDQEHVLGVERSVERASRSPKAAAACVFR